MGPEENESPDFATEETSVPPVVQVKTPLKNTSPAISNHAPNGPPGQNGATVKTPDREKSENECDHVQFWELVDRKIKQLKVLVVLLSGHLGVGVVGRLVLKLGRGIVRTRGLGVGRRIILRQ